MDATDEEILTATREFESLCVVYLAMDSATDDELVKGLPEHRR